MAAAAAASALALAIASLPAFLRGSGALTRLALVGARAGGGAAGGAALHLVLPLLLLPPLLLAGCFVAAGVLTACEQLKKKVSETTNDKAWTSRTS